ncbi:hypothetical protein OAU58_02325, partial [Gammaproteobacteria bacterium]|nr:hypothetical protein [Gammaproteobacteria bacterium]
KQASKKALFLIISPSYPKSWQTIATLMISCMSYQKAYSYKDFFLKYRFNSQKPIKWCIKAEKSKFI